MRREGPFFAVHSNSPTQTHEHACTHGTALHCTALHCTVLRYTCNVKCHITGHKLHCMRASQQQHAHSEQEGRGVATLPSVRPATLPLRVNSTSWARLGHLCCPAQQGQRPRIEANHNGSLNTGPHRDTHAHLSICSPPHAADGLKAWEHNPAGTHITGCMLPPVAGTPSCNGKVMRQSPQPHLKLALDAPLALVAPVPATPQVLECSEHTVRTTHAVKGVCE